MRVHFLDPHRFSASANRNRDTLFWGFGAIRPHREAPRNSNGRLSIHLTLGLQAVHTPRALSQSIRSSHYRRIFPHPPVVLQARPFRPVSSHGQRSSQSFATILHLQRYPIHRTRNDPTRRNVQSRRLNDTSFPSWPARTLVPHQLLARTYPASGNHIKHDASFRRSIEHLRVPRRSSRVV